MTPQEPLPPTSWPAPGDGCGDPLVTPLSALLRRGLVSCAQDRPVGEALALMRRHDVGSVLLTDANGAPAGMFTLKDLRDRVALGDCDVTQPIANVMTARPHALPDSEPAFEAALTMARHAIHHVVVTRAGQAVGVISEKDLFALQQVGVARIASALCAADDLAQLRALADDIRRLAHNLMAQGVGAEQLTRLVSQLNDQLTRRILTCVFADTGLQTIDWCWLALGSEGRYEQTLHTDQDNGLIFAPPDDMAPETLRPALLTVAARANDWLDQCGFPLCKGGIMAGNPRCCLADEEWRQRFADWIFRGDAPVLLNASIFFDFRALAGDTRLARALRVWLNQRARENRRFLKQLAANALDNRPPLGLMRDFVVDGKGEEAGTIDLKLRGSMLFVDAARVFALAANLDETGTVARLRGAGTRWNLNRQEVDAWVESFLFIQQMRLRLHHAQSAENRPLSNRLDPARLSTAERQALRSAFRQARKLQGTLDRYFQF